MKRMRIVGIITLLVALGQLSCGSARDLAFKTAFVTKQSGVQPVARVKFYLLSKDIRTIEREAGQRLYISERQILLSDIKSLSSEIESGESNTTRQIPRSTKAGMQENLPVFQSHLVATTVTDFDGTGKFENLPKGVYFLSGYTTTKGGGIVAWSLKVDTEGDNKKLILDQNNAIEFEEIE